jgi:hypothetical protein
MGTEWTYKITWHSPHHSDGHKSRYAVVLVLVTKDGGATKNNAAAKNGGREDIQVRMWTNSDSSSDIVTAQHPLALYVSLVTRHTLVPVTRATVIVSVRVRTTERNASLITLPPIRLLDGGNGDPDLVGNDGVYSRYMTRYPAAGRYTFTVTATDSGGDSETAVFARQSDGPLVAAAPPCCGSRVPTAAELVATGPFRIVMQGPAVNLLQVPLAGDQDRLPPARVGDLRVRIMPESSRVLAAWTAPGGDFDEGAVSGYR